MTVAGPPPTRIGPYELLEVLGEGGFGVVHRAMRREPVVREVAIKLLKPGLGTSTTAQRFEAERNVLARMEHPGIAKLLDAGPTADGRSYVVMELVRGPSIVEYCRDRAARRGIASHRAGPALGCRRRRGCGALPAPAAAPGDQGGQGACVLRLRGHVGVVVDVEFSADGQRLVSAGHDGTVRVWEAARSGID